MPLPPGPVSVTSRTSRRRSSLDDLLDLAFAPEERRRRDRQVRLVQRLERREVFRAELEETLGRTQVLQPVEAEVAHIDAGEVGGRLGQEHLPTVPGRGDPRSSVHVEPDVALVGTSGSPVCSPIRTRTGPPASAPVRRGRRHRIGRMGEGNEERIALRVDLDAAVGRARVAHDPAVLREASAYASPSARAAASTLDVGEEERDRPVGS